MDPVEEALLEGILGWALSAALRTLALGRAALRFLDVARDLGGLLLGPSFARRAVLAALLVSAPARTARALGTTRAAGSELAAATGTSLALLLSTRTARLLLAAGPWRLLTTRPARATWTARPLGWDRSAFTAWTSAPGRRPAGCLARGSNA